MVEEARLWWRLNVLQVGAFWAVLGGVIVACWPVAGWFLTVVLAPAPWWIRSLVGLATTAITMGSFLYARLRPQPNLPGKPND